MSISRIGRFFLFLGIFRSISAFKLFLHLPVFGFGVFFLIRTKAIDRNLIASGLLVVLVFISCFYNGLGFGAYLKALMLVGAIGIAEFVRVQDPARLAKIVANEVLIFCLLALAIESVLIALGFGERARALGALVGGPETDTNSLLPRFLGFRGGSAYSAMMLGTLGLLCFAYKFKMQGFIYFVASLLMLSRGPLLAVIAVLTYFLLKSVRMHKAFAFVVCAAVILSPALVVASIKFLPFETQKYLIEVSTMRYFHWVSFLNFGIQNPFFGVGYDNYKDYYIAYSFTQDALEYGFFTENRLLEAHNMMMDIVGELGFVAAGLWAIQVFIILFLAARGNAKFLPMLLYICVCSAFVSSLSDWCVWVCFGLVLHQHTAWRRSTLERVQSN
ncbi:O-antigen ligase family protein [Ruegeria sp. MALMAid1280]|uniref:O-antigen ligase family protein n=1 Tax=Ruegeria sp. MALMAid1280 TaxID=3411634 RepID=UPI003BA06864